MKDNKTYKAIKASERLPNYEDDFYTERGVIVFFPDQKAFGYYDKEYPDGPEEFIEVNIQYWLEEQEQGDDIRDILIDFIADWYKDNPTVSKEKIIKMADNYLAKFPNGQPKQVTLKEANEIISKEHPDVRYTSEQPSIELSAEEIIKISEKYANEYGGSMFGLAYKSFRAGIEYIIKNRK